MYKQNKRKQITGRKLITRDNPRSIVSEQYRTLRTNINFSMTDRRIQTLLFTSAVVGEGKSTTAANVAIAYAQEGKKVLLVDADMRKPTMHYTFQRTNTIGLSNLLTGQWKIKDVLKPTDVDGLHLVTCGQIPPNPAELLSSSYMNRLIIEMKSLYDIIIFDAPPVLLVADSKILANKCDGTILVIQAGKSSKGSVIKTKDALIASKANIIGTVINKYKYENNNYYHQYYRAFE